MCAGTHVIELLVLGLGAAPTGGGQAHEPPEELRQRRAEPAALLLHRPAASLPLPRYHLRTQPRTHTTPRTHRAYTHTRSRSIRRRTAQRQRAQLNPPSTPPNFSKPPESYPSSLILPPQCLLLVRASVKINTPRFYALHGYVEREQF